MSDLGKETREPSSKRTQRYRQGQVEQPQKRALLKVLGIGGAAAAVGGIGLAWRAFSQEQRGSERPKPVPLVPPTTDKDIFPREDIQYYLTQLRNLDQEILKNPDLFKELAPKIGDLAAEYFSNQMGYDKARYKNKMHFLLDDEFQERVNNNPDCIDINPDDNSLASIFIESQDINFNLTRIFAKSIPKSGLGHPATGLFSVTLHELHHHSTPILTLNVEGQPPVKLKGALYLVPNSKNYSCPEGIRLELEEAIVQDSTERMLNRLGLSMSTSVAYEQWVSSYRDGVINKLFGGDHKQLLMLHQQTKQDEFFTLVGQRLGSSPFKARQAGEEYLRITLLGS